MEPLCNRYWHRLGHACRSTFRPHHRVRSLSISRGLYLRLCHTVFWTSKFGRFEIGRPGHSSRPAANFDSAFVSATRFVTVDRLGDLDPRIPTHFRVPTRLWLSVTPGACLFGLSTFTYHFLCSASVLLLIPRPCCPSNSTLFRCNVGVTDFCIAFQLCVLRAFGCDMYRIILRAASSTTTIKASVHCSTTASFNCSSGGCFPIHGMFKIDQFMVAPLVWPYVLRNLGLPTLQPVFCCVGFSCRKDLALSVLSGLYCPSIWSLSGFIVAIAILILQNFCLIVRAIWEASSFMNYVC